MTPKVAKVTDPQEIEELLDGREDIGKPFAYKPNGDLWVLESELKAWREGAK